MPFPVDIDSMLTAGRIELVKNPLCLCGDLVANEDLLRPQPNQGLHEIKRHSQPHSKNCPENGTSRKLRMEGYGQSLKCC